MNKLQKQLTRLANEKQLLQMEKSDLQRQVKPACSLPAHRHRAITEQASKLPAICCVARLTLVIHNSVVRCQGCCRCRIWQHPQRSSIQTVW